MKVVEIKFGSVFYEELINQELLLWPDNEYNDLYNETKDSKDFFFGAVIDELLVGFIQLSIRKEYVNGSSSSPVGFIEGLYVLEELRGRGIGKELVEYVLKFTKDKGIKEVASDVLIDNILSQKFHEKMGFKETERVVYYIHELE